ncbi:hypothetical protein D3C81_1401590 [compost metagenome]
MPRAERDLLDFCKEVVGVTVEHHFAQRRNRHQFLGDNLGGVEQVEFELVFISFRHDLYTQLPLRVITGLDRFAKVATVEVGVLARKLLRLVPQHRVHALARFPVKLDEARHPFGIDQAEGVHAKTLHHP